MANQHHASEATQPRQLSARDWKAVGKRVKSEINRDNLSIVAAGVAFYAFFALFPAIAALVSIYGLIANPSDVERLVNGLQGVVPQQVTAIISSQLEQVATAGGTQLGVGVLVGILVSLWSATKGTKSLMTALNIAYEEEEDRSFFRLNGLALLLTLGAVIGVIVAVLAVVVAPALLGNLGLPGAVQVAISWLRWPLLALLAIFGLGVFYRLAPSRRPAQWRWISYGSVTATLLWLIASGLFSWYVSNFGSYNETYGSMAAIIILLLWFYLSAYVILLGAELNSEMERQTTRDTTVGGPQPRGRRGASSADDVAGEDQDRFKA